MLQQSLKECAARCMNRTLLCFYARVALHGQDDGPLHWLVNQMLKHSLRGVRLRAAAAAQLAAAWATRPDAAALYVRQLQGLLLEGLLGDGIGVPSTGVAPVSSLQL